MVRIRTSLALFALVVADGQRGRSPVPVSISNGQRAPFSFEQNFGQWQPDVLFASRLGLATLALTADGAAIRLGDDAIRMRVVGASQAAHPLGTEPLVTKSHYFLGPDPSRWRRDVPHFSQVRYRDIYPRIDLVFHRSESGAMPGASGGLPEYDFVVAPGADPELIELELEGHESLSLDESGHLRLAAPSGMVLQHRPVVYQPSARGNEPVEGRYRLLAENRVGFAVGAYDATRPLVIDPVLSFATYLGDSNRDEGRSVFVDKSGNIYLTGSTYSPTFPSVDPAQGFSGDAEIFVSKLNGSGNLLLYSTFIGAEARDDGYGIAVDDAGNAVVVGRTQSGASFPLVNAWQSSHSGASDDAFVLKLNAEGNELVFSTLLGGSGGDKALGIALDSRNTACVVGFTASPDFPPVAARQPAYGGGSGDAFLATVDPSGVVTYASFHGGGDSDDATGVALGADDTIYVTGTTSSDNFPASGSALQPTRAGLSDAFVSRFSAGGATLKASTYIGGGDYEQGFAVAVDLEGNAYVAGVTTSTNFPASGGFQPELAGGAGYDGFVIKLSPDLNTRRYGTYLGGNDAALGDWAYGIAVDFAGNAFVTGKTDATNFPVSRALASGQNHQGGAFDAFMTKLNRDGSALSYSTHLGGAGVDIGNAIALTFMGQPVIVGSTTSTSATFPETAGAYDTTCSGNDICGSNEDVFVAQISNQYQVTSTLDQPDAAVGDGVCATSGGTCTLRAAIQESNHANAPGSDTIVLTADIHTLGRSGEDDTALNGDLDVLDDLAVFGYGAWSVVQAGASRASAIDRIFDVTSASAITVLLQSFTITHGLRATSNGGCVLHSGNAKLRLMGMLLEDCQADRGGAIYAASTAPLFIERSLISGNKASGSFATGGGMHAAGYSLLISNSTVSGNVADGSGGGIYLNTASAQLNNVTIAANTADADTVGGGDGGGIFQTGSAPQVENSILADNLDGSSQAPDCAGTIDSHGFDHVGLTAGCTLTNDLTGLSTGPALLGPLQATFLDLPTHALSPGSPAIDGGNPNGCFGIRGDRLVVDQRGFARPRGVRCDKGSFELDSADLSVAIFATPSPAAAGQPLIYTIMVTNAGPTSATKVKLDFTPFPGAEISSAVTAHGTCQSVTAVSCELDPILIGSVEVTVTLVAPPTTGMVQSSAQVHAAEGDPAQSNNTATIATAVLPGLSIGHVDSTEGASSEERDVAFFVTLSASHAQPVSVQYTTVAGTATADEDFVSQSGTVTIPAGLTHAAIVVTVLGDDVVEADESFALQLSSPWNAVLVTAEGTGTLLDDDVAPQPAPDPTVDPIPEPPPAPSTNSDGGASDPADSDERSSINRSSGCSAAADGSNATLWTMLGAVLARRRLRPATDGTRRPLTPARERT